MVLHPDAGRVLWAEGPAARPGVGAFGPQLAPAGLVGKGSISGNGRIYNSVSNILVDDSNIGVLEYVFPLLSWNLVPFRLRQAYEKRSYPTGACNLRILMHLQDLWR